jgi:HEAT repeat protein
MALFGLLGPPNIEKLEAKRDVQGLIKALGYRKSSAIRKAAARALGQIKDTRAVEPLIGALKDEDRDVQEAAVDVLGQIGDTRAVEPLIAALKDGNWEVVLLAAARALGKIGDARAVEPLVVALKDSGSDSRRAAAAAVALGQIRDARAVEPLVAALKDEYRHMRWAVAQALGQIGDARAVEPLVAALKDGIVRSMREAAAMALAEIEAGRAVTPLVMLTQDKHLASEIIHLLHRILERAAADIAPEDLRTVIQLNNVVLQYKADECGNGADGRYGEFGVDCSQVRQLARQELIRRGIEA